MGRVLPHYCLIIRFPSRDHLVHRKSLASKRPLRVLNRDALSLLTPRIFATSAAAVGPGMDCPGLLTRFDHAASIFTSHDSGSVGSVVKMALGSTISIVISPGPFGLIIFSHGYA